MDDAVFTENIHKLIERSHKYQSSTSNFFQNNKQTFKRGPSENFTPQRQVTNFEKKEIKLKVYCDTIKTDSASVLEQYKYNKRGSSQNQTQLSSSRNKNSKAMFPAQTFMINLANQNLDLFPTSSLDYKMNQVQLLDLQDNRLKAFPKEIYSLIDLKVLNLNSNFIKNLPTEIFNHFPKIQNFSVNNNLVPNIHYSIDNWANHINYLDVSNNRIDSINTLTKLTQLVTLSIHSNEFQVLSYNLVKLQNLKEFSLDWFKYIQPPQEITQKETEDICKLFDYIRSSQIAKLDDPSIINISSDDMEQEEGVQFKDFVSYYSDSISSSRKQLSSPATCELNMKNNTTIIHKAAIEQDIGVLLTVIHEYANLIDQEDNNGYTPLGLAIKEEKYFSAKTLIFNGANVNKSKTSHGSILNLAIVKGQIHMISDLLQHNADTKRVDSQGNSALHYCMATFDKDTQIFSKTLNLLLKYGVNPNMMNTDGWTAMHLAVKKGVHEAVEVMINHNKTSSKIKFDFSLRGGKKGSTSLHLAAYDCNFEVTQILLLTGTINALCKNKEDKIPSQYCPHNYKQYKLLKRYEYKQIMDIIFMRKKKLQDQIYDYFEGDDSNYEIYRDTKQEQNSKSFKINSLWIEVLGGRQLINQNSLKQEVSQQNNEQVFARYNKQRLYNQLQQIQGYITHLFNCYTRAKFEAFKEDNNLNDKLSILAIILKVLSEITSLQLKIGELSSQLGHPQANTQHFTEIQVQHCFLQLLNQKFKIQDQQQILTCPDPASSPHKILQKKSSLADRSNKFLNLRNSYQLPNCLLQPSLKRQGNQLIQIEQPKHETSQDGPNSPSNMNESYQDESQSNFEEVSKPKPISNFDNLENIYLSELLVKVQRNQQVSHMQKNSLLQLTQSTSILTSYEAHQSLAMLQLNKPKFLDAFNNKNIYEIHNQQLIQAQMRRKIL